MSSVVDHDEMRLRAEFDRMRRNAFWDGVPDATLRQMAADWIRREQQIDLTHMLHGDGGRRT